MIKLKELLANNRKIKLFVIVTAPYQGGKSSFIRSICADGLLEVDTSDYLGMTAEEILALETPHTSLLGVLPLSEDAEILFWEKAPARRFDRLTDELETIPFALICLVNSSRPEAFRETKLILESFKTYPHLLLANFQTEPDAWHIDDLKIALKTNNILPCDARERKDCLAALSQILKTSDSEEIKALAELLK